MRMNAVRLNEIERVLNDFELRTPGWYRALMAELIEAWRESQREIAELRGEKYRWEESSAPEGKVRL